MRWNALAMVVRANQAYGELGGHIASYASAAEIFEVGFNHFFRGDAASDRAPRNADLVYFQPTRRPASIRAPSSRAGSGRSSSRTTARSCRGPGSARTRIRG
jgi:pyruvate dehydrogenase complex dehydrogenase (E1) component